MATFTITTPVNIDTLTGKAGNDAYNINGGYLTIDQDSRYGLNQTTSSALGTITMSATLGGTVEVNATAVRLIPYNSGSGNVPVSGTNISRNGASGKLIAVYSALNAAPTASGSAMPVTGYIKVKQVTGSYSAGALTGITAIATGVDVAGWIELVGVETGTATVNRLNQFLLRGTWYEFLGVTTSGTNTTTYQMPTNGALQYCGGVWVETSTPDQYEFYPCAGTLAATAATVAIDLRGKLCWVSTGGLIRFGHDGTNSTGGYVPPAGRKIRIPNIILNNCTSAAPTANVLPNATLATRYDFNTVGGGAIDIDGCVMNWYPSFSQAYSVYLKNMSIMSQLSLSEIVAPVVVENVNVGQEAATANFGLLISLCFAGGTFTNCVFTSASLAASGRAVCAITDSSDYIFTDCVFKTYIYKSNAATHCMLLTRVTDSQFTRTTMGGGRSSMITCDTITYKDTFYYAHPISVAVIGFAEYVFESSSGSKNVIIDGYRSGDNPTYAPFNGILAVASAGCSNIIMKNIGSPTVPCRLGTPLINATWSRATTTVTVTTPTAHGLLTNSYVYVLICDNAVAITLGAKIITVTSSTTFTFTGVSSGTTSGNMVFYGAQSAYLAVLPTGAAASNVKIQRCYVDGLRTGMISADNSSKEITIGNCYAEPSLAHVSPFLDTKMKGLALSPATTIQTSCYGTDWLDWYSSRYVANQNSVSWSRSATVVTVTSNNHNLVTSQTIMVIDSSSIAAIPLGVYTVTALSANTFTVAGINAGTTTGTLSFIPLTSGLFLSFNEPTTADKVTIVSGTPSFTSAGTFYMPTVGMSASFADPEIRLGHTGFSPNEIIVSGSSYFNFDIRYAINTGSGFGSYKNLSYVRTGSTGTTGAFTFTLSDSIGVSQGDYVFGTGIAPLAKVVSIDGNTITLDRANTATVTSNIRFNQLPNETINQNIGFQLKLLVTTRLANTTAVSNIRIYTTTDGNSRSIQYPLDPIIANLTLTGLQDGSEVRIFSRDVAGNSDVELSGNETVVGGTFVYTYTYEGPTSVNIVVANNNYQHWTLNDYSLTDNDSSIPVQQIFDRQFIT